MNLWNQMILLIGCIADTYMLYDFFHNYFDLRERRRPLLVFWGSSIGAVMATFGINLLNHAATNLLGGMLIGWIYLSVIFSANVISRLIHYMIVLAVFIGSEFLLLLFLGYPTEAMEFSEIAIQYFTMKLLTYVLLSIIKRISGKAKKQMSSKIFLMYLWMPITSLGMMMLSYYSSRDAENVAVKVMLAIFSGLMFLGNIVMFYAFQRHSGEVSRRGELEFIMLRQEMEWKHQNQMSALEEGHRRFLHDIGNQLKVIGELAEKNETGQIVTLIKDLKIDLQKGDKDIYSSHPIVNILLQEKAAEAKRMGVSFEVFVEPDFETGRVRDIDLIAALGNLLDNAIRGASEAGADKWVQAFAYTENEGSFLAFKVLNSYNGTLCREDGKFLTTKRERGHHGLGIKSVEDIAGNYAGNLIIDTSEQEFQAVLLLSIS